MRRNVDKEGEAGDGWTTSKEREKASFRPFLRQACPAVVVNRLFLAASYFPSGCWCVCVCVCAFVRVRGTEEVRERDLQSSSLRPLSLFLFLSLVSSETLTIVPPLVLQLLLFSSSLVSSA